MVKLFTLLINKKSTVFLFIILGIASGLFNLGIISLINEMIEALVQNKVAENGTVLLTWFLVCIACWYITRRVLLTYLIKLTQRTLWEYRMRIIRGISKSDFMYIHKNKSKINSIITEDVSDVAIATSSMVDFLIYGVTAIAIFGYLAYLSLYFFIATVLVAGFAILVYELRGKKNTNRFDKAKQLLDRFHGHVGSTLDGFKETKVNPKKGEEIILNIEETGNESVKNNSKAYISFLDNEMIGQVAFYVLVAGLAMFLGNYLGMEAGEIVTYLFTLLFVQGSLEVIMTLLPTLSKAGVAMERIESLEFPIDEENGSDQQIEFITQSEFDKLSVENISFEYPVDQVKSGFNLEGINFSLNAGEVVFIAGGNGSGKTTLVNIVLALLEPDSGTIFVNGDSGLFQTNKKKYRSLFAPVFSDFYLFEELYGIQEINEEEVNDYLKLFEIDHKVTFENRKFSTKELSTGQRKRLALISVLLEKKPILVLDEWAADQDPQFRKKFYREIIPMLKEGGFTVLAITHDDNYFDASDRLLKMNEGRLQEFQKAELSTD